MIILKIDIFCQFDFNVLRIELYIKIKKLIKSKSYELIQMLLFIDRALNL